MAEQGSRMLTSGKSERERCVSQKNETQLPTRKEGGMDITLDFDEKKYILRNKRKPIFSFRLQTQREDSYSNICYSPPLFNLWPLTLGLRTVYGKKHLLSPTPRARVEFSLTLHPK